MNGFASPVGLNISAVERETGLSKDVLRVWERRYGFPVPMRDANGERIYPAEQVARLRTIRRLLDSGLRPGRLIALDVAALDRLAAAGAPPPRDERRADSGAEVVRLVRGRDASQLQQALSRQLMRQGLLRFVQDTAAPLTRGVGDAWMRGELQIFEEHLCTEQLQALLRGAIAASPQARQEPRVLVTTLPDEQHGLGVLMVEAMLATEGVACLSLGTQTPITDIGLAAAAHAAQVVALSFSAAFSVRLAGESLSTLRRQLPPTVELWAGGEMTRRFRRALPGVRVIADLPGVLVAVAQWRAEHAAAQA